MPISRMQQPRQLYGLGSLVKSVTKAVKNVAKSPIGKAALLLGGGYYLGGGQIPGLSRFLPAMKYGNAAGSGFGLSNILPNVLNIAKMPGLAEKAFSMGTAGKAALGIAGASAIGGMFTAKEQEDIEELRSSGDPEKLKNYLRRYYTNLNPDADTETVEAFVRANAAYGGRMGFASGSLKDMYQSVAEEIAQEDYGQEFYDLSDKLQDKVYRRAMQRINEGFMDKADMMRKNEAEGGRMEENVDQASGIMGLPQRTNEAGVKELDLRKSGGFIPPVGVKEKADDIPAMLSNNEFVFTADAVRGMGDGNVNLGAQRMYDMMKKLEDGGRA